ncbi:MAG: hypothetical protein CM1200mP3_05050 [Chloroflexota bacterium]|nr:MAG: hypothetical protein CM1200mP3_05050 [Chloroflexota bacterium]
MKFADISHLVIECCCSGSPLVQMWIGIKANYSPKVGLNLVLDSMCQLFISIENSNKAVLWIPIPHNLGDWNITDTMCWIIPAWQNITTTSSLEWFSNTRDNTFLARFSVLVPTLPQEYGTSP